MGSRVQGFEFGGFCLRVWAFEFFFGRGFRGVGLKRLRNEVTFSKVSYRCNFSGPPGIYL